jgi:hypothetical protein
MRRRVPVPPPSATMTRPEESPSPVMCSSSQFMDSHIPMELDSSSLLIPLMCGLMATPTSGQVSLAGSLSEPVCCPPLGADGV